MATQLDNIVKAQRFNELKARIKNECLKRKYVGPVDEFGGSAWDFNPATSSNDPPHVPTTNKEIEEEQYKYISIPIRKINWKTTPNGPYDRVVNDIDLLNMETKIAAFELREVDDYITPTDCAALCTGTCTTTCTTGCGSSCEGSCVATCSGSCYGGCKQTCTGECGSSCTATCQSNCKGICGQGCIGGCYTQCAGSSYCQPGTDCASGVCTTSCTKSCASGCSSSCQGGCGTICRAPACGNNCQRQ